MKDFEKLNDDELEMLRHMAGDDCDMSMVECVVRELRTLREQVKTLTDVVERQVTYIKELQRQLRDLEPSFHGGPG